jgi:recombination associated protein RdgC
MFKNLTVYRLVAPVALPDAPAIAESLAAAKFNPCTPTQQKAMGWVPPRGHDNDTLVESVDGHLVLKIRTETRNVTGSALAKRTDELADLIEQQTGRKPGKKERKSIKDEALQEMLPRAFSRFAESWVWIDTKARTVAIDTSSQSLADDVTSLIVANVPGLVLGLIITEMSPSAAMAHWLSSGEPPQGFTVDRECELKSCDEMKSVVRYGRHPLDTDEVKAHIVTGKMPTRLALTWRDRVSLTLTHALVVKKLEFLDVVFEGKGLMGKADKDEVFEANVAIATAETAGVIADLIEALGGEQVAA